MPMPIPILTCPWRGSFLPILASVPIPMWAPGCRNRPVIRDLGVWIDNGLTMSTHITKVVAGCFASLQQLRSVRRSLSHESYTRLMVALMLARLATAMESWLDFLPVNLTKYNQLQSVLHAAAWLIHGVRRHDHVTPLLQQLHWLSVPELVIFQLCVMVYRCLHGLGPEYFSEDFRLVSEIHSRQWLRLAPPMPTLWFLPHDGLQLIFFPSVLWHCWLGDRKGIRPVKNWMLVCWWWWWFDWSFARLIASVVQLSTPPPSSFASINTD